jgi:beta-lactamase regulating signal transducer with metallopeptidase domain
MEPAANLNLIVAVLQAGAGWGANAQAWSGPAGILIGSLWQGALVACGLALCMRLAPRMPAGMRYGIWAAGFAAVVGLPFLPVIIDSRARFTFNAATAHAASLGAASGVGSGSSTSPWLALDARWGLVIAALWLTASVVRAAGLAVHTLRMRRLWRSATRVPGTSFDALLKDDAARSGARRAALAELCTTTELDRPCVIGFFRPRILIPAWLFGRLSPAELEQVVLHELEHLRRMDDWMNLVQKMCLVVFPLNPALWWLERRLCAEREMACDDGVVRRTKAPRAYAACLAGLAERGLEYRSTLRLRGALSIGAWQRRPELAVRVHRLLRRSPVLSPAASAASLAVVACGLVAGTIALARSPQLVAFVAPATPVSSAVDASVSARTVQPGLLVADAGTDSVQGPVGLAGPDMRAYRAVKTMAILPVGRAASESRNSVATSQLISAGRSAQSSSAYAPDQARQTGDSNPSGRSLASLVPTTVAARMKAQEVSQASVLPNAQTKATQTSAVMTPSGQPGTIRTGWLVLTTYEEVRTTSSGDAVQGDAVVGATSATSAAAGAKTDAPSTSFTVTRVALRFVQPASSVAAASSDQPASNAPAASNAQPASNVSPTMNARPEANVPPASNSSQPIAIPYRDGWLVIQL